MRLFIAINMSCTTRTKLLALRDELQGKSIRGNFTLAENIHLTLVFLGECDIKQKDIAVSAIEAARFEPFTIEIDRLGSFKRNDGDLWWTGVRENKALLQLQQELKKNLTASGFSLETRKYSPHITLARKVVTKEKERTLDLIKEAVTQIDLMESKQVDGKLTYVPIYVKKVFSKDKILDTD